MCKWVDVTSVVKPFKRSIDWKRTIEIKSPKCITSCFPQSNLAIAKTEDCLFCFSLLSVCSHLLCNGDMKADRNGARLTGSPVSLLFMGNFLPVCRQNGMVKVSYWGTNLKMVSFFCRQ